MSFISEQLDSKIGRRNLLQMGAYAGAALLGGGALAGCGGSDSHHSSGGSSSTDAAVLNFALNLEYLEAEYYLLGTTGTGLTADETTGSGTAGATTVKANPRVTFNTDAYRQYSVEIATDEHTHVTFLRGALNGGQVAKPAIDLEAVFNVLYRLALGKPATSTETFDPFNDELSFLVGAFIFEDVGVTAYHGGSTLISNKDYLSAAAGILGVEAYHAGIIRTILAGRGNDPVPGASGTPSVFTMVNAISALRDSVDNNFDTSGAGKYSMTTDDQGIGTAGNLNLVPTDANSIAFSRTTTQVLNIVYGNAMSPPAAGGFFPAGMNGAIR